MVLRRERTTRKTRSASRRRKPIEPPTAPAIRTVLSAEAGGVDVTGDAEETAVLLVDDVEAVVVLVDVVGAVVVRELDVVIGQLAGGRDEQAQSAGAVEQT